MYRARVASLLRQSLRTVPDNTKVYASRKWVRSPIRFASSLSGSHGNIHQLTPAITRTAHTAAQEAEDVMFCYQCEQTKRGEGCKIVGVCGKSPQVAALQDLLTHIVKGLAVYSHAARQAGATIPSDIYQFTFSALFSTLTNVNFDATRFPVYISDAVDHREEMKKLYEKTCQLKGIEPESFSHDETSWFLSNSIPDLDDLEAKGRTVGLLEEHEKYGNAVGGVRNMTLFGLKGMATYARHADLLGQSDDSIGAFTHEALSFLTVGPEKEQGDLATNLKLALRVGETNIHGMELLDKAHRARYGVPRPTEVMTTPRPGKCILVSGHDLLDLEMILKATEGQDIDVYTHGELLPAHSYPELHKYKHFAGHFGGAWQMQKYEFPYFPGPVVITTNCLIEPMRSYKDHLYTLNDCGWEGVRHLHLPGDASVLVEKAKAMPGFTEKECQERNEKALTIGFGREVILENAGKVLEAVKAGQLKRVFLIGGCDGAENKRSYFTTLARSLPEETLILTLGCAKYRINRTDYGTLGDTGLPRLMDMGQCNDAYGAVVVAKALADALDTDINSLPLSLAISWFEQKAVAVLLSLLHLGVKNIRLGPNLPAFITPEVLDILIENYNIQPTSNRYPVDDMHIMMGTNVQK